MIGERIKNVQGLVTASAYFVLMSFNFEWLGEFYGEAPRSKLRGFVDRAD